MTNVLITGGSGLIGGAITEKLKSEDFNVAFLTRKINTKLVDVNQFLWDPDKQELDPDAINWADHIINLAGETVAQRWTNAARARIINSRVDGTTLLKNHLAKRETPIKSFISASAIGYYGTNTGDAKITEKAAPGDDFLAEVVKKWEQAIDACQPFTERLVKIRIGIVLAAEGGALEKVAMPIKFGVGAPLGSGKQWMSWIHLNDLATMFVSSLTSDRSGVFNGVAPNPVTNKEFTKLVAKQLHRPLLLPNVPGFALKIFLGEMSSIVLGGNKVMPVAFQKEEFKFEYNRLEDALSSLF